MRSEAASHGMYHTQWGTHPRVQLLSIAELLNGARVNMPPPSQVGLTFKRAPKSRRDVGAAQASLFKALG
jgi:hypothetical protein